MSETTSPAIVPEPPSRKVALLLGVIGPWGLAQLYLGQIVRAAIWMVVSTVTLLVGAFGMRTLGATFGYDVVFGTLTVGMVLMWIGSVVDVLLVPAARFRRVRWLVIAAYWLVGVGVGVGLRSAIRTYAIEAFKVPSGAMLPAMLLSEHFLVEKRTASAPLPSRSEMIVFASPETPDKDYLSRVIAVPGDTLEVKEGRPSLNGWEIPRCLVGKATMAASDGGQSGDLYLEFLDGQAYLTFYDSRGGLAPSSGPFVVGEGEVWVMGDNRNNAHDSRYWFDMRGGGVPRDKIKGSMLFRWYSPIEGGVAWSRFGVAAWRPMLPPSMKDLEADLARCLAERPSSDKTVPPPPAK